MNLRKLTQSATGLITLVVAVVSINVIAAKFFGRLDVTEDKVYSLSPGTEKILADLGQDVTIQLYFSRSLKELPIVIKQYATRVEEVLNEYASTSGHRIKTEVIDPKPDTDEEEWARKYGIQAARLPSGEQMYFGLVFLKGSTEHVLPYLDPRREEFLEYDLSEAIVGIFKEEKSKIGILSSLPVAAPTGHPMGGGPESWVFVTDLERSFDVSTVEPSADTIDPSLKALILVHPKDLSETTLYAIDQYLLGGGRLIVAVDPMSRTDLAMSSNAMQMGQMPQASSNLEKLFAAWDIEFNPSLMVGDALLGTRINAGGVATDYPFFISLDEANLSSTSVITSSLKQMLYAEGGAIALKPDSVYSMEPLIETTQSSGTVGATMAAFMPPQDIMREMKVDEVKRVLAGLLRGKFKSAFPDGRPQLSENEDGGDSVIPHLTEAKEEGTVLVIADVDFLADHNAAEKFQFGNQTMVRARNDNLNFLVNAVDFMAGSQELISIRSRGRVARPFHKVAEIQRSAQEKWKAEEEKLTNELQELQQKLSALQQQRTDGNRFVLNNEQQSEIAKFRSREAEVRKRRRIVRKNLREDIEKLGTRLVVANLLVVPLLVSGFGLGVFVSRNRRMKKEKHHA